MIPKFVTDEDKKEIKERRKEVKSKAIAMALPVGKWFVFEDIKGVNISKRAFQIRANAMPYITKGTNESGRVQYRISKADKANLILWAIDSDISKKKGRGLKSKVTTHKLSIADICQNIAEGMKVNNILPGTGK